MHSLHCLHGFLGLPSDWASFNLPDAYFPNLYSSQDISDKSGILLGYSLGGRIALHTLFQAPASWKGAIFISTHPGLQTIEEKEHRLQQDKAWAHRFRVEPWDPLMKEWDSQSVFQQSAPLMRKESDFDREKLAFMLERWSLGHQEDFRPYIEKLNIPVLWIAGEHDTKFNSLIPNNLGKHPLSKSLIIPGAGHRVPWDQPALFQQAVEELRHAINWSTGS